MNISTAIRGAALLATAFVCVAACGNGDTLPSPSDPSSATKHEDTQCGGDKDCKDQQRCVAGSCTSAH